VKRILVLAVAIFLGWFSLSLSGCGDGRPKRVTVSGQVLIDGEPLPGGSIKLVPQGARPSMGEIDAEGRFTLTCFDGQDGAVPGKHRVEVVANEALSFTEIRWFAPKKYANFAESGLEIEIHEPTDSLVINLTWDGGKPFVERVAAGGGGERL